MLKHLRKEGNAIVALVFALLLPILVVVALFMYANYKRANKAADTTTATSKPR